MVKAFIVRILNWIASPDANENFEWTNSKIALVLFSWFCGLIGAGFFIYGMYRYASQQKEEYFQFMVIGVAISFLTGITATVVGKFINRKNKKI